MTLEDKVEKIYEELFPENTITSPSNFFRRFEAVEKFTLFELEKNYNIFNRYRIKFKPWTKLDFKQITDFKLVKIFSLVSELVRLNNLLFGYNDHTYYVGETKTKFGPLSDIIYSKERLEKLCRVKMYDIQGEIDLKIELMMDALIAMCYNSMISSQRLDMSIYEPNLYVKEHDVKVVEIDKMFLKLKSAVNEFLTVELD